MSKNDYPIESQGLAPHRLVQRLAWNLEFWTRQEAELDRLH